MSEIIEELAAVAHESWAGWTKYLFSKCGDGVVDGLRVTSAILPVWAKKRWMRQMGTPYTDLPEEEKESDRVEARKYLEVMEEELSRLRRERDDAMTKTDACGAAARGDATPKEGDPCWSPACADVLSLREDVNCER